MGGELVVLDQVWYWKLGGEAGYIAKQKRIY